MAYQSIKKERLYQFHRAPNTEDQNFLIPQLTFILSNRVNIAGYLFTLPFSKQFRTVSRYTKAGEILVLGI